VDSCGFEVFLLIEDLIITDKYIRLKGVYMKGMRSKIKLLRYELELYLYSACWGLLEEEGEPAKPNFFLREKHTLLNEVDCHCTYNITGNIIFIEDTNEKSEAFVDIVELELYPFVPNAVHSLIFPHTCFPHFSIDSKLDKGVHLSNKFSVSCQFHLHRGNDKLSQLSVKCHHREIHLGRVSQGGAINAVPFLIFQ
jgi:hypothetical protein